jgi:hypothetical protein
MSGVGGGFRERKEAMMTSGLPQGTSVANPCDGKAMLRCGSI